MSTWNEPVIPKRKGPAPKLEVEQVLDPGEELRVENGQPAVEGLTEIQQLQQKVRNLQNDLDAANDQIRDLWVMIQSRDDELDQFRRMER